MALSKEEISEIKKGCVFDVIRKQPYGGQHVGIMPKQIRLTHEDLGFSVTVDRYRSQIDNRELAMTIFELYLSTYD